MQANKVLLIEECSNEFINDSWNEFYNYICLELGIIDMNTQQRHKILQLVMWDYNISNSDLDKLLDGKIEKAGHYTRETLFAKMVKGLPWYTIIQFWPIEVIKEMLTEELIGALWPKSLQNQYKYVRKRLQEIIPNSG